jgi:NADPH:quinone reductase-like Zn-dependent oxidoreductase
MRAAWFEEFGAAKDVLNLGEIDTPEPGPGEVLVRLHASGVNPSDVKKRSGSFPDLLDGGFVIPNSDGAGVIEAIGEGVDKSRIGERVWVFQAQYERRFGTAAEYVAISSNCTPRLSDKAGFEVGACLGIPVMTAHRAVFADGGVEGRTILVTGGAGRVGHYAVQWASHAGARVIATASNADDMAACKGAGKLIDRVVDVEFGANLPVSVDVLRTGGTIATYASAQVPEPKLPFFQMMYKDLTIRMIIVYAMPDGAKDHAIADINKALADNWLQHRVAHRLPLNEIAHGNGIVEKGDCRGAVILEID